MSVGSALPLPRITAATRMGDPDYPGALRDVPPKWRVAVNLSGKRYTLQRRAVGEAGDVWLSVGGSSSLLGLLDGHGEAVPGLVAACKGLPNRPGAAMPELAEAHRQVAAVFAATDWRRGDYGRVVARDGNLRVIVEPNGERYRLQWVSSLLGHGPADDWRTLRSSASKGPLADWLAANAHEFHEDRLPARSRRAALSRRVRALFGDLPDLAAAGTWPELPKRPA